MIYYQKQWLLPHKFLQHYSHCILLQERFLYKVESIRQKQDTATSQLLWGILQEDLFRPSSKLLNLSGRQFWHSSQQAWSWRFWMPIESTL